VLGWLTLRLQALSLQIKLTLFAAALVLFAVGITGVVAWQLIDRLAESVARARLEQATQFVQIEYQNLLENARITAEVLSARPPLQRSLIAEDAATLGAMLQSVQRTRAGDFIAVVDAGGETVVALERGGTPQRGVLLHSDEAVVRALLGLPAQGLEVVPGESVRAVVALPVRSGEDVVGAVMVASFLDNVLAERLKLATSFDVTFYAGDRATATTLRLPDGTRQVGVQVPPDVSAAVMQEGLTVERVVRGPRGRLLVRYSPLRGVDGQIVGMFSVSAPVAVLFETRTSMLAVFGPVVAGTLALAFAAAALVARALSQPVRALVLSVQRIGEGDLTTPVQVAGQDEVGRLAAAIEDMRRRLLKHAEEQEQLNRLKDQYLFNVAHELKTPLTTLAASVELLAQDDGTVPEEERRHFITMVQRSTTRLQSLVDNLLDLGSLRTGRFHITPRPAVLSEIAVEAVASMQSLLEARRQRVELRFPQPPPVVLADARRIQQVLVNLLSNAIKYGPEGDTIIIAAQELDDQVRVSVTDHGPGIPPEEQPHLFEAYFRSAMARQLTPGVGLGLAIVKAIVEAHGGKVGVESAPQRGTTMWFTLPLAGAPAGETTAPTQAGAAALAAAGPAGDRP
jgi:signal transduction histidine kinase